jgi:hypothetical protein
LAGCQSIGGRPARQHDFHVDSPPAADFGWEYLSLDFFKFFPILPMNILYHEYSKFEILQLRFYKTKLKHQEVL